MGGGNGDGGVTAVVLEGGKGNGCRGAGQPIGPLARPGVGASAGAGGGGGAGGVSIAGFVCDGSKRSLRVGGGGAVGAVGPLPGLPVITPGGGGAGGG